MYFIQIAAIAMSVLGILCFVFESKQKSDEGGSGVKDTPFGCILCLLANAIFAFNDGTLISLMTYQSINGYKI